MSATGIDTIRLQIMWNRLISVVEEQAPDLYAHAFSPIVRECGDLSAGVFGLDGRMYAQAVTGRPAIVNSMAESVKHFLDHFPIETMNEGDAFITRIPGWGRPSQRFRHHHALLSQRQGEWRCSSRTSHLTDIGGLGTATDATDVHMEGIYIPMLKLADRGVMNETLMAMIRQNTRQPVESEGDVYSLAACNDIGCQRLVEMMDEFDLDDLEALGDYICDTSEKAVRDNIAKLPNGAYKNTMTIDGIGEAIDLVATLTIHDDKITVDYDGSSPKSLKGINVPMAYTTAYTCFGLSCIVSGDIPNNAGSLAPFEISAPGGTILNAPYPSPVCSRHVIGQMLPDVAFGCLAQAAPERVPAEGASCLWNITMRGATDRAANDSKLFTITAVTNGGTGARPVKDGLSATAYPSGVRGTPVEINETVAPIVFHRKEFRPDSGGAGAHRGGLGQVLEIESAIGADFELLAAYDRIDFPARGRNGGLNGEAGSLGFTSGEKLRGKGTQTIPAGKIARFHTPGGAGFGDPKERDPAALSRDIENGLITKDAAARDYGYVSGGDD